MNFTLLIKYIAVNIFSQQQIGILSEKIPICSYFATKIFGYVENFIDDTNKGTQP